MAKPIFTSSIQLFASPKYLKHHLPIKTPEDLVKHKTLYMSLTNKNRQWHLKKGKEETKVKLKCDFICDDFSVLQHMAVADGGVVQLPGYLAADDVNQNRLLPVLQEWQFDAVDIYALVATRKSVSPKLRVFLDYLTNS